MYNEFRELQLKMTEHGSRALNYAFAALRETDETKAVELKRLADAEATTHDFYMAQAIEKQLIIVPKWMKDLIADYFRN